MKAENINDLPVHYYKQASSWMNAQIFEDWFHKHFVPLVEEHLTSRQLEPKALLLMDNTPCHHELVSKSGLIKTIRLPPNTTSLIQTMDQTVINALKQSYRKETIRKMVLSSQNENANVEQLVKDIDIKHCIFTVANIWNQMQ